MIFSHATLAHRLLAVGAFRLSVPMTRQDPAPAQVPGLCGDVSVPLCRSLCRDDVAGVFQVVIDNPLRRPTGERGNARQTSACRHEDVTMKIRAAAPIVRMPTLANAVGRINPRSIPEPGRRKRRISIWTGRC